MKGKDETICTFSTFSYQYRSVPLELLHTTHTTSYVHLRSTFTEVHTYSYAFCMPVYDMTIYLTY